MRRRVYHGRINRTLEWTVVVLFHVLVATGVALVGTGASSLQSENPTPNALSLVDAGIGLLTASWVILSIWTAISHLPTQQVPTAAAFREGKIVSGHPACQDTNVCGFEANMAPHLL